VTIRQLTPKPSPSLFIDQPAGEPVAETREPEAFIPPQPERAPARAPRMPRIDELPVPAQNEIRARRGELPPAEHPDGQRKSLLQRLASVGLGRRQHDEEEAEAAPAPRAAAPLPPQGERLAGRPMPRMPEPRPEPVSEYAKRPAPQGLDQHGRQAPVHNSSEEDQLDIPAFLRRQAN
jgi:cell division protein FtsZ